MTSSIPDSLQASNLGLKGFRHAFFTAKGSLPEGLFPVSAHGKSLNPPPSGILEQVGQRYGLSSSKIRGLKQVHSAKVVTLGSEFQPEAPWEEADGLVTKRTDLALAIVTADCQPVLLIDPVAQVIGAAHAGWRGAFEGVIGKTLDAMEALGAQRQQIHVALGPAIGASSYEVDEIFRQTFLVQSRENDMFFCKKKESSSGSSLAKKDVKWLFDLAGYTLASLRTEGVASCDSLVLQGYDTYACCSGKAGDFEEDSLTEEETKQKDRFLFYSYRRSFQQGVIDAGRQVSLVSIDPVGVID